MWLDRWVMPCRQLGSKARTQWKRCARWPCCGAPRLRNQMVMRQAISASGAEWTELETSTSHPIGVHFCIVGRIITAEVPAQDGSDVKETRGAPWIHGPTSPRHGVDGCDQNPVLWGDGPILIAVESPPKARHPASQTLHCHVNVSLLDPERVSYGSIETP